MVKLGAGLLAEFGAELHPIREVARWPLIATRIPENKERSEI
jgi:hypothetical protein